MRGVVYGRSLLLRPAPPSADRLLRPLRLTDVAPVPVPPPGWRDRLRLALHAGGLITLSPTVRLRWRWQEVLDGLQSSLLGQGGQGRGRPMAVTHPLQLLPAVEFMMGLPPALEKERRALHGVLGRALVEYRRQATRMRERPLLFAREAAHYFALGYKDQQIVSRIGSASELFHTLQRIYDNYYFFRANYIFSIVTREPPESGYRLFSKYMRASFFLSTIQEDGTLSPKPSYRQLPPKEHVLYLVRRDQALQARLREDEALLRELQQLLRYFRSLRPAGEQGTNRPG